MYFFVHCILNIKFPDTDKKNVLFFRKTDTSPTKYEYRGALRYGTL